MRNLRNMTLLCLLTPCLALCAQSRNPYDSELKNLQAAWPTAGKLQKLVLLDRMESLRDYITDRPQVLAALETVQRSSSEEQTVKTEADACLGDLRHFRL